MSAGAIERIALIGTGLIGSSIGLALRAQGFAGPITGWDRDPAEAALAQRRGAVDAVAADPLAAARASDVIVLATPVFAILDWMEKLAPALGPGQLVTDVGSTKRLICERAAALFPGPEPGPGRAAFLPGHPMAGKEVQGAAAADAQLFQGAVWLFAPPANEAAAPALAAAWRGWVERLGSRLVEVAPDRHDELCAWASHLPQMVGTALAALLEDSFGASAGSLGELRDVGGRALREMTRLGASPFSMWRDVAQTNTKALAATLQALEQRLAHLRENLKQPELRDEFERANRFREHF